jgi:hypothetical protein
MALVVTVDLTMGEEPDGSGTSSARPDLDEIDGD